jgi:hypothetical protein
LSTWTWRTSLGWPRAGGTLARGALPGDQVGAFAGLQAHGALLLAFARRQHEQRLAAAEHAHVAAADHDRGAFVDAEAEVAGAQLQRADQARQALALQEVLVGDRHRHQVEALAQARRVHAAGDHRACLDRGAGRAAADDPAARQQRVHLGLEPGAEVGVGDLLLRTAAEPDRRRCLERCAEVLAVGLAAIARVQQRE